MGKVKLDEIDHQILDMLIDNTRTPFTDIAKKLLISAGTVHVRVKKMEEAGIIGPFEGSKAREVLVKTLEELEEILRGLKG